ncbi:hypothetical protein C7H19_06610 [Aphanothece hegewaldii CCALA 016]|uniref:Heparinase n=1 Tax=Aphanothece hegewaldii CCALA 016 TaxID=2107694 RepID=A0A2T1M0G9_9CHRO|nr:hypothetical protein [Aphanothece hegewaldii]PSF38137.1 hypothetical protein C7H19_06610 [Aphanothece hegewaldii CCALA 016]
MNFPKMKIGSKLKKRLIWVILPLFIASCTAVVYPQFPSNPSTQTTTVGGVELFAVDEKFRNQWTNELETQFQQRSKAIIQAFANPQQYGNTFQENEKRSYPNAMFDFLAGNRERAIVYLQQEDAQSKDHAHTNGIDYYFSFTLKGQIRKYFLFGSFLDPAYRQKMYDGAKQWTQEDPLTRPHPIYGNGDGTGEDWSIKRRGLWVDGRNTDNLRAMRETSVYLMAEETGNEATRQRYKQKLQRYVWALYNIGMGEWDSEVYHGHTFAPYLNLYDFAKDPEVKQLAKSALDWLSSAAAIKYYRGGWGGPVKRDYGGGNTVLSSDAARTFWLYFGDTPLSNPRPTLDTLYMITSTYRPPLAVVAVAQKKFNKPVEVFSTKPLYENWKPGNDQKPGYYETQFFGQTYQMGSLAGTFADGDVAPFKLLAYNSVKGVDFFVANTGNTRLRPGKNNGDQIGQYRNILIWLRPADQPFYFQLPKSAKIEVQENIWFIQLEKTWLAIYPINLNYEGTVTIEDQKYQEIYSSQQTLKASPKASIYSGFALEVGENETHGSYEIFKQNIQQKQRLNITALAKGKVSLEATTKQQLDFTYNQLNLLPMLRRDGKEYKRAYDLYKSMSLDGSPISLGWKKGKLKVKTEEYTFESFYQK